MTDVVVQVVVHDVVVVHVDTRKVSNWYSTCSSSSIIVLLELEEDFDVYILSFLGLNQPYFFRVSPSPPKILRTRH